MRFHLKSFLLAVAVVASVPTAHALPISVSSVGNYAPNPNALTLNNAASNSAAGGITLANFQTLMTGAFASNTGGVINFENATGWVNSNGGAATAFGDGAANPVTVSYGVAQSESISFWRTDVDANLVPLAIDSNNNNGTNVVSGTNYMGVRTTGTPVNFAFSKPLSAIGFSLVPRGQLRNVSMTATLENSSLIVGSTEQITASNTPGPFFWGFVAPVGNRIVGLRIDSPNGFSRFDDLGFVAVPEPGSIALIGLAGLVLVTRRRAA
jgi:hypothetical protein